jgi:hypothetical protein
MKIFKPSALVMMLSLSTLVLSSCSTVTPGNSNSGRLGADKAKSSQTYASYESRLPQHIASSEKTIIIDPNVHAWGAYSNGSLTRAGLAVAGANYCPDIGRRCHTSSGSFRVYSLGSPNCKSSLYPRPHGGAPMPYCMFFNRNQAMHGTYEGGLAEANLSHGCVRMHVSDAEWLRYNFVNVGTKVVVKPY